MEKMDSSRYCQHPKRAHSLIAIPKIGANEVKIEEVPWICPDCGEEGVEIRTQPEHTPGYAALKAKKARGGFNGR